MTRIWVFSTLIAVAFADVGLSTRGGYSLSAPAGSYLPPRVNQGSSVINGGDNYVPKVYKHVYVHAAPDEPAEQQTRTIRVPGGDSHVNIVFIKAPSQSSQAQTEVILPEQDEHKNLVYVLLKENNAENNIKITRPQPKAPSKPEVHFIRYKDNEGNSGVAGVEQQPPQIPGSLNHAQPAPSPPSKPDGLYETPSVDSFLTPPRHSQPALPASRVYGTPADVPPLDSIREPLGLYGTPSQ